MNLSFCASFQSFPVFKGGSADRSPPFTDHMVQSYICISRKEENWADDIVNIDVYLAWCKVPLVMTYSEYVYVQGRSFR